MVYHWMNMFKPTIHSFWSNMEYKRKFPHSQSTQDGRNRDEKVVKANWVLFLQLKLPVSSQVDNYIFISGYSRIRTNTVKNYSQNTPWPSQNPRENTAICNVTAQMLHIRENYTLNCSDCKVYTNFLISEAKH